MEGLLASRETNSESSYSLTVVQQPVRARMCGFGDKDRRPISPPVIVKLSARDPKSGEEVLLDDLDTTFLVLAVDLRTPDTSEDANLIFPPSSRPHSVPPATSRTPTPPESASRGAPPSGPQLADFSAANGSLLAEQDHERRQGVPPPLEQLVSGIAALASLAKEDHKPAPSPEPTSSKRRHSDSSEQHPALPSVPSTSAAPPLAKRLRTEVALPLPSSAHISSAREGQHAPDATPSPADDGDDAPLPNLIGTLHTSSYRAKDLDGESGIFFVFPDLSVRTEGSYKLRLRLVNLCGRPGKADAVMATEHTHTLVVQTVKKFQGMLDPTPLSQCLAKQGVRIPTRKAAKAREPAGSAAATAVEAKDCPSRSP